MKISSTSSRDTMCQAEINNNNPLVSVIIPVYNGELYLAEAIESILIQSYTPIEIIVVDDGSTDDTKRIVSRFRHVKYIYQTNKGPPSARNTGLSKSQGHVISFLDSDDLWSENKLEIQLSLLDDNPSIDIVWGQLQWVRLSESNDGTQRLTPMSDPLWAPQLGTILLRRSVFDKVGLFDETQLYCDDVDWFMRAKELGLAVLTHNDITYFYRRHNQNITNQRMLDQHYLIKTIKNSLNRRRNNGSGIITSLPEFFITDVKND